MTFDPVGRRLYFSNLGFLQMNGAAFSWHRIEAISTDRTKRMVVVSSAVKPRGVWVDPGK